MCVCLIRITPGIYHVALTLKVGYNCHIALLVISPACCVLTVGVWAENELYPAELQWISSTVLAMVVLQEKSFSRN